MQGPHLQGLDASSDEVRNHAHAGPLLWVLRQEWWSGPSFLQVLNDGQLSRGDRSQREDLGRMDQKVEGLQNPPPSPMPPPFPLPLQLEPWKAVLDIVLQNLVSHKLSSLLTSPTSLPLTNVYQATVCARLLGHTQERKRRHVLSFRIPLLCRASPKALYSLTGQW